MGALSESPSVPSNASDSALTEEQKAIIRRELRSILESPAFCTSKRCQQFLSYVVEHNLHPHDESLKERTIGVELFQRDPSYSTGEDAVVRVKAGEVRRRLQQHYAVTPPNQVRIDIPLGGYIAEFHWRETPAKPGTVGAVEPAQHPLTAEPVAKPGEKASKTYAKPSIMAALVLVAIAAFLLGLHEQTRTTPRSVEEFWAPLSSSPQPVLICLPSVVVYRPSLNIYSLYSQNHPNEFQTQTDRLTRTLPLAPDTPLIWKDMVAENAAFVARDDAYATARISGLLDRIGKAHQLRSGNDLNFEDLRGSPVVLVGALNNRWSLQVTAKLPFAFVEEGEVGRIQEQKPSGRTWRPEVNGTKNWSADYAIVARIIHSTTGRPVMVAAGIGGAGTWAAGEFLANEEYMNIALQGAPKDWKNRNMEVVLKTSMTDGLAGPPQVVATEFW